MLWRKGIAGLRGGVDTVFEFGKGRKEPGYMPLSVRIPAGGQVMEGRGFGGNEMSLCFGNGRMIGSEE